MGASGLTVKVKDSPRHPLKRDDPLYVYFKRVTKKLYLRGKSRGRSFNVSIDYLKSLYNQQFGLCAVTKLPMTMIIGPGVHVYNVSVDRIDNSIGYEPGNVQLVCYQVNIMRGQLSVSDFKHLCRQIVRNLELV